MFGWRIYEGSACGAPAGKRSHCTRYKDTTPSDLFDRIAEETIRLPTAKKKKEKKGNVCAFSAPRDVTNETSIDAGGGPNDRWEKKYFRLYRWT